MELQTAVQKLIEAFGQQNFTFAEKLHNNAVDENWNRFKGTTRAVFDALERHTIIFDVDYSEIDKEKFDADLAKFQTEVGEEMLLAWKYKFGALVFVGIIYADNMTDAELKSVFLRFDNGLVNTMRKYVGRFELHGEKPGVTGTMMPIFSDTARSQSFNENIGNYYNSHFWKKSYVSTISVDTTTETFKRRKNMFGIKWHGDFELKRLAEYVFPDRGRVL